MTSKPNLGLALTIEPVALAMALEKSEEVIAKVEACADDLGSDNAIVKRKIAAGVTTLSAHNTLVNSERVESKVQECAEELHEVNATLAEGIVELKQAEAALSESQDALHEVSATLAEGIVELKQAEAALSETQDALAHTEAALATAQEAEKKAQVRALHDATTGLPNRVLFDTRLEQAIALAKRHGWTLAVLFLDLDRFKAINDTHGHAAGDSVLKEVARRLAENCRDGDTVCRNGGDEFLYLLVKPQGRANIGRIAAGVLANIARPIEFDDLQLVTRPSIGIAVYPGDGDTAQQLVKNADAAMYRAKKGPDGCAFFDASATAGA